MKKSLCTLWITATVFACVVIGADRASAVGQARGVTPTTITIGIPYIDLATVDKLYGLHLNQGSYPDAYDALIDNLNAHGGINGRKVIAKYAPVNPAVPTSGATSCTQLVQDDHVFVAVNPYFGICYLEAGVPTINGTVAATVSGQAAPNFTLQAPANVYDPIQLAMLTRMGVFKGKKVGVWGGPTDSAEVKTVDAALAKDHVRVVQTAFDSAPATDSVGQAQQDAVIAQRFQNAGIDEVVAVGQGSAGWPLDQQANQSTYNPPWVATNYNALYGFAIGSSANPVYLRNVLATTPIPAATAEWKDPLIQRCVATIEKESPGDSISSPIGQSVSDTSNQTYIAPMSACTNLAMFTAIAKAAGKNLTVSHFENAGFGLHNVTFPGIASSISFGPDQAYANVPIYLAHYDPALKQMLIASHPASN
jgi:Periplasmic binding protein